MVPKKLCRICFEGYEKDNPLLTPCSCKGSSKWVHLQCLNNWKEAEPSKGLFCSVCKERLATVANYSAEILPQRNDAFVELLLYPHIGLFVMINSIYFFDKEESALHVGNMLFTLCYIGKMVAGFSVSNKKLYRKLWIENDCHLLLLAHLCVLSFFPQSPVLSLITSSWMLPLYYHQHLIILHQINDSIEVVFTSRV